MEPAKPSSFKLPSGEVIETVYVRLKDGRIVPRAPHEVIKQPTPPAVGKQP